MLKLAGCLAVFGSLSWWGMERGRWYRRRLDCLHAWQTALLEGERMLCDLGCATGEYLRRMQELSPLGDMAKACLSLLEREERFEQAWQQALGSAQLPLQEEDVRILSELGGTLGRYDGEEQRRMLKVTYRRLESHIEQAEEQQRRLSRMWSVLGISAGALAVVLLY